MVSAAREAGEAHLLTSLVFGASGASTCILFALLSLVGLRYDFTNEARGKVRKFKSVGKQ